MKHHLFVLSVFIMLFLLLGIGCSLDGGDGGSSQITKWLVEWKSGSSNGNAYEYYVFSRDELSTGRFSDVEVSGGRVYVSGVDKDDTYQWAFIQEFVPDTGSDVYAEQFWSNAGDVNTPPAIDNVPIGLSYDGNYINAAVSKLYDVGTGEEPFYFYIIKKSDLSTFWEKLVQIPNTYYVVNDIVSYGGPGPENERFIYLPTTRITANDPWEPEFQSGPTYGREITYDDFVEPTFYPSMLDLTNTTRAHTVQTYDDTANNLLYEISFGSKWNSSEGLFSAQCAVAEVSYYSDDGGIDFSNLLNGAPERNYGEFFDGQMLSNTVDGAFAAGYYYIASGETKQTSVSKIIDLGTNDGGFNSQASITASVDVNISANAGSYIDETAYGLLYDGANDKVVTAGFSGATSTDESSGDATMCVFDALNLASGAEKVIQFSDGSYTGSVLYDIVAADGYYYAVGYAVDASGNEVPLMVRFAQ